MRKCRESEIEFDFSNALQVFEHDTTVSNCEGDSIAEGNTVWPGVDFRIEDSDGEIWIEVKNWRGTKGKRNYLSKMKSRSFAEEMRAKFLGTTAFLAWNGNFRKALLHYALLFESHPKADPCLLGPFNDLLRSQLPIPNRLEIKVFVMNLEKWNETYPEYPAKKTY